MGVLLVVVSLALNRKIQDFINMLISGRHKDTCLADKYRTSPSDKEKPRHLNWPRHFPAFLQHYTCWIPAKAQPPWPLIGLEKFQTSENPSAGNVGSSLITPVNLTLAK
jgi:hypothetical protein